VEYIRGVRDGKISTDSSVKMETLKRKRSSYNASFKLKVINQAESIGNRAAAREYGVPEKNVRSWRMKKESILEMPRAKRTCRHGLAKYPELEKELLEWITDQRSNGYIISLVQIQLQALKLNKKLNTDQDFKASIHWVQRFMKRHGLCIRQKTKISQKLPADLDEKLVAFHSFVLKQRKLYDFELSQIGNMDETPMSFDLPRNRTVDKVGAKTVQVRTTGHERTNFTLVLACMADGTKLKPMVIFKRKTIPKGEKIPSGLIVHCHPKGWMDEAGVLLWLNKVWDSRPGAALRKKSLLVWDQFRAHKTDKVKKELASLLTTQAVIPGGLTSLLQPLDVVLNKPVKDRMRQKWMAWMSSGQQELTKAGNFKRPGLSLVLSWVKSAWDEIPSSMVEKSFLKTGISNKLDGTEDDALWENTPDQENSYDEEADPNWDTDEKMTPEEWDELFGSSDDEEFEGF